MPDGGHFVRSGGRGVVLAAARRFGAEPFGVDDVHARLSWMTRSQVKHHLVALATLAEITRAGVFAERRRGSPRTAYVAAPPRVAPPEIVARNGSRRAPDTRAADERWSARVVAGARFDASPTAIEAGQLREIAGWPSD